MSRLVHHVDGCAQVRDWRAAKWDEPGAVWLRGRAGYFVKDVPREHCVSDLSRVTCRNCLRKLQPRHAPGCRLPKDHRGVCLVPHPLGAAVAWRPA